MRTTARPAAGTDYNFFGIKPLYLFSFFSYYICMIGTSVSHNRRGHKHSMKKSVVWFLALCFILLVACDMPKDAEVDRDNGPWGGVIVDEGPWDTSLDTTTELVTRTTGLATNTTGVEVGETMVTETKWSQVEKEVVLEVNRFRADPLKWCKENNLTSLWNSSGGITPYKEFFGNGPHRAQYNFPVQKLYPSTGLHRAALHQLWNPNYEHSDAAQVKEYYANFTGWGENLSYYAIIYNPGTGGTTIGAKIVYSFLYDLMNEFPGHRINIAQADWESIGVGCFNSKVIMQFGKGVTDRW